MKPAIITPVENSYKHNSCIVNIVLFSIFLTINVVIGSYFIYYKYKNRNKKMFLDIIMFIKQQFTKFFTKLEKLPLKIELIIFTTIKLI